MRFPEFLRRSAANFDAILKKKKKNKLPSLKHWHLFFGKSGYLYQLKSVENRFFTIFSRLNRIFGLLSEEIRNEVLRDLLCTCDLMILAHDE